MSEYNVKLFKLVSGEEFIAQLTEENYTRNFYKFAHPVVAVQVPDTNDLQFVPWMPLSGEQGEFVIEIKHVIMHRPVSETLVNAHRDNFGPRVQVPDKKIVLMK